MADVDDLNTKIIEEFRSNGGRVGGGFEGAPCCSHHHRGQDGEDPGEPDDVPGRRVNGSTCSRPRRAPRPTRTGTTTWWPNPRSPSNGNGTVRGGGHAGRPGRERDRIYAEQASRYPGFAEYEEKTDRVIPVVALERT